ncbi:Exonuclease 3'-5' domain-containing protein 2 [Sergentomyia squamirostris]
MTSDKRSLMKNVLVASVGIGLAFVVVRYRKNLMRKWKSVWQKTPLRSQHIEIVNNVEKCQEVVETLKSHCRKYQVLGFDCEWVTVNGLRHPVALLQLASHTGLCALFRLSHIRGIPPDLKELLEREDIIKVGVAPNEDARLLCQDYSVTVASVLDLRSMAHMVGEQPLGLSKLSHNFLDIELDKDWRLRCSDWSSPQLTSKQVQYAANDAFVAIELFKYFSDRINPRKFEFFRPRGQNLQKTLDICAPFIDVTFKSKNIGAQGQKKGTRNLLTTSADNAKTSKETRRSYSTRSRPLYYNCFMEAPDGELLCSMDIRKADWYVTKGLADVIKEDPYTLRLKFEPSGRATGNVGDFDKTIKVNQCVVCGKKESYIRKYVIPREYRKFFPIIMKSHMSHDVLLMCTPCHQKSNRYDLIMRQKLSVECNAPRENQAEGQKFLEDKQLRKVKSLALALKNRETLPEARIKVLETNVLQFFPDWQSLSPERLDEILEMESLTPNPDFRCHGEVVVEHYKNNSGLVNFEKMWRQHFVDTMNPQFLPEYWSLTHSEERLEIKADRGHVHADDLIVAGLDPGRILKSSKESSQEST